jgi:HK97 family phage portal protein
MQALGRVLAADEGRTPFDDYWYQPWSGGGAMPQVTAETAMAIPAVYACVTYVSEDIAKIPLSMYEDLGEQGNQRARDHELQEVLHHQPNKVQTALEFREMVTAFAMLRGRGVSEIRSGPSLSYPGRPSRRRVVNELVPLHPSLVRRDRAKGGAVRYIYQDPNKDFAERTILAEDAFVVEGRLGRSVIELARVNLGTELAMERYAGFMFSRGAKHQGVISAKGKLPDPVRKALREALDEYSIDGPRAGRPLLLEDGMEWQGVSLTNQDLEYLAQRQFNVAQVCRWFRVPPHKVFDLTRSTNNNIEEQGVDYVVDSLLGWAVRWEQAIWRDLVVEKDRYFAKHTLDGLLRGDFEARAKGYALAVQWGWMTRNEIREKEDMNPLEGLDKPLTPLNMTRRGSDGPEQLAPPAPVLSLTDGEHPGALLHLYASDAAARIVRREAAAMAKLADRTAGDKAAWRAGVASFYADQGDHLARDLHIPEYEARRHAQEQALALQAHGPSAMEDWMTERVAALTAMAVEGAEVEVRRMSRTQVNVLPAPVHIADGAIRVEAAPAPDVHVPVQVDVATPPAQVTVAAPPVARVTKTLERDTKGQIVRIVEES